MTTLTLSQRHNSKWWTIINQEGNIVFAVTSLADARARLDSMLDVIELESDEAYQRWLIEREAEFCTE